MKKSELRRIITDQKMLFDSYSYKTPREYASKFDSYLSGNQVIIISGVRRCGKSTLLHHLRSKITENDYFINFDDERLAGFKLEDFQSLVEVFIELYGEQKKFYFDEIQNILGWERFVRRLQESGHKIFITGSNASMLSRELGTHLTGRYHQIELYPFSFNEYLQFRKQDFTEIYSTVARSNMQKLFREHMEEGGFPGYLSYKQADYLKDLYDSILYRDIVARYSIVKISELKEMVYFIASNIGKLISYGKIKQMLQIGSVTTIKNYFSYLHEAYLVFTLSKFDYSAKRQILAPKKIYFIDTAMAQTVGLRFSEDFCRILENIVYIQLMRQQKEVFYHADKRECDFIVREQGHNTKAYQVTQSLADPNTAKREIEGLIEALGTHNLQNGTILTLDEEDELRIDVKGINYNITVLPVWRWLLISSES